jgi:MFS family permease
MGVIASVYDLLRWIQRQLTPEYRFGRPHAVLTWWSRFRTACTVVVAVATTVLYRRWGFDSMIERLIVSPIVNAAIAAGSMVASTVILIATARPGTRRRLLTGLRRPVATMATVVAGYVGLTIILAGAVGWVYARAERGIGWLLLAAAVSFALIPVACYWLPATAWTAYLSVRHWFRAADGHPFLPAMVAIGYATVHIGLAMYQRTAGELDPQLPTSLAFSIQLGSPLVLGTTAAFEIVLVRGTGAAFRDPPPQLSAAG